MPKKAEGFNNPAPDKLYGEPIVVQVDGAEYKLALIGITDISAVYARIRDNRIAAVVRNFRGLPPNIIAEAFAHTACTDPTQEDYWNYANTPPGIVYIMWRCLNKHQPTITENEVAILIERQSFLKDLLFAESGITEPEKPKDPDEGGENKDPFPVFGQPQKADGSKAQDG